MHRPDGNKRSINMWHNHAHAVALSRDERNRIAAVTSCVCYFVAGAAVVKTLSGKSYTAKHIVIAMPPAISARIIFDPALPAMRQQLNQHYPMGTVVKLLIRYESPFWRQENRSGFGTVDASSGLLMFYADSTDPKSKDGVIVSLISGSQYDQFAAISPPYRKAAVLDELAMYLGPKAKFPTAFDYADWPAEQFVQGSYAGYLPPLAWTRFGPSLVEPHGAVHWAGTEASPKWPGYFEGAIIAGKNAAEEILMLEGKTGDEEPFL